MAGPIVFVGTHHIHEGKLEIAKEASRELAQFVQGNHPRVLHFEIYVNDETGVMTVIQVHPDEESLMLHMQLAADHFERAYGFLDTEIVRMFGTPSDTFRQMVMGGGENVRVESPLAGFSRLVPVPV